MTTLTIDFPDGSTLPLDIEYKTGKTPPENLMTVHTVTLGWVKATEVTLTLTPGKVVPPPSGPPAITVPAGYVAIADYVTPSVSWNGLGIVNDWVALSGNDGMAATMYEPSQVSLDAAGDAVLTAQPGGRLGYLGGYVSSPSMFSAGCRVDFAVTIPSGDGLWSACWFCTNGSTGEIDVVEVLGKTPSTVYGTTHATNTTHTGWTQSASRNIGPNVFSLVWEPGMVTLACDYIAYAQFTPATFEANTGQPWPYDTAQLPAIVSLAVGGPNEWSGPPDASTRFPSALIVHSVTAYT